MKSLALAIVVLAAGCKTDPPAPGGGSTDQSAAKPRSGKVDLPAPHPATGSDPAPAPATTSPEPAETPPPAPAAPPPTDEQRATLSRRRAEAIRNKLDTNGDGKLTVDELKATPAARRIDPEATDTNHDGEISVDELDAMMAKRMGRGMVGRGSFGGVTRGQR
jgi:EF hand domain-containing protein